MNVLLLVAALLLPAAMQSQAAAASAAATDRSGADRSGGATSADSAAFAQPGDIVRLRIWREPDMSGDFTVDTKGVVTFPRLGALQVTRIDADSLQRMLVAEYAKYLKNPAVEVVLLRRVRVVGAVRTPGLYTADQTMRIRDVLALAGGASAEGRIDRVRIDRDGRAVMLNLNRSPSANEFALRSGDQLYVPERSWVARNTPLVAAILSVTGGLLIAFAAR
jgi:polysaccharide export outer membrane protein